MQAGSLYYHFASKDALELAVVDRLHALVADDVTAMAASPDGPIAYFIRTSVMEDGALDRAILATSRLAQGGNAAARDALRGIREQWADALRDHTKGAAALDLVMLVSDGLYFHNALAGGSIPGPVPSGADMDALIALVERAAKACPRRPSARALQFPANAPSRDAALAANWRVRDRMPQACVARIRRAPRSIACTTSGCASDTGVK